jgi:hypothetical protein
MGWDDGICLTFSKRTPVLRTPNPPKQMFRSKEKLRQVLCVHCTLSERETSIRDAVEQILVEEIQL